MQCGVEHLSDFPASGTLVRYKQRRLEGCRFILVSQFEKLLIFYQLLPDHIEIVRILHGARDLEGGAQLKGEPATETAFVRASVSSAVPALVRDGGGNVRFAYDEFFKAPISKPVHRARLQTDR